MNEERINIENVKISVIIPIHNTPISMVKRCFDSILAQDFDDYEIIGVCNGCDKEYVTRLKELFFDIKIKIIEVMEAGVSNARNIGLEVSKGKYIIFVDADDELIVGALKKSYKLAEEHMSDVISAGMIKKYADKKESMLPGVDGIKQVDSIDVFNHLLSMGRVDDCKVGNYLYASPCAKIYRKSTINNIRFSKDLFYLEDILFNMEVVIVSKAVFVLPDCWYVYYQNNNSAMHSFDERLLNNQVSFVQRVMSIWDNSDLNYRSDVAFAEFIIFSIRQLADELGLKCAKKYVSSLANHLYLRDLLMKANMRDFNGMKRLYILFLRNRWFDGISLLLCLDIVKKKKTKDSLF